MDGNNIRKLRKQKGMTIEELSQKSGFTASYISQVERNIIEPSLTGLRKLCSALNVSVYCFLEQNEKNIVITRKTGRQKLSLPENNMELEFIVPVNNNKNLATKFSVYESVLTVGNWSSPESVTVDSDTCFIINKGTLIVAVNDSNELLKDGDSIYIRADIPHRLYNPSEEDCEFICITIPSLY